MCPSSCNRVTDLPKSGRGKIHPLFRRPCLDTVWHTHFSDPIFVDGMNERFIKKMVSFLQVCECNLKISPRKCIFRENAGILKPL